MCEGNLSFCWHIHQPFFVDDEEIMDKLRESYLVLLETHEEHEVPFGLSISGNLLSKLKHLVPEFIDKIKELKRSGIVEVLGTTYYHAAIPIIPPEHLKLHIKMDLDIKENTLDCKPEIYFPADFAWVPWLADILIDFGVKGTVLDSIGIVKTLAIQEWKWIKIGKTYKIDYSEERIDEPIYQLYNIYSLSGKSLLALIRNNMISTELTKGRDGILYMRDMNSLDKVCKRIEKYIKDGGTF
ncbi:MAG: hypothetical protein J7K36_11195, partial [Archaeoglobaceae archaeon]|nr:hypothetical protein [Archaeoglobaceae archaeon]